MFTTKTTPEVHIKTCCVIKCLNTPSNSNATFFSFPAVMCRSYQRNKWVQAIKSKNGRWWMPTAHSFVCSDHFVQGQPSSDSQDTDFVPSIFINKKKGVSIQSRAVSVKKFALEYIKYDALLEKPVTARISPERKRAYVKLAEALCIPLTVIRGWERRFRQFFEEKMAEPPDNRKPHPDGTPHWLTTVANRLHANPIHRLTARAGGGPVSPAGVVVALCAAARARGTLCSTALYNDVRRVLRLSSPINDLHAIWVSAQRVSLQQVVVAGRAGDAAHAAVPPVAVEVADLVLQYTDVDILTDESVTLYEESAALHTLWQLIQRHRLEDAAPAHSRVRAQRWTRAHRSYLDSGRKVSLVVLQRRWYELKQQARVRLSMHWRRSQAPELDKDREVLGDPAPEIAPNPHVNYPRPAPLHIAILKRYPHVATGQFRTWRQQVLEGIIVTEPLDEEGDVTETQTNNKKQSSDRTGKGDSATVKKRPKMSNTEQPTFDLPVVEQPQDSDPLTGEPTYTKRLDKKDLKDTKSNINEQTTAKTNADGDAAMKQLYPNMSKVEQPTVDESNNDQKFYNVTLIEQNTAGDQLTEHTTERDPLAEDSTVHEPKVDQPIDSGSLTDTHVVEQTTGQLPGSDSGSSRLYELLVMKRTVDDPLPEQTTNTKLLAMQDPLSEQTIDTDLLSGQSTVDEPKIEQAMGNDLSTDQSTVRNRGGISGGHAGNTASAGIQDKLDTPDRQGGPDILSKEIHRAEDKSNEVIQPKSANSPDIDTDTEDDLVIDESPNKTPCSLKLEPISQKETLSPNIVSPYVTLQNSAPILEVLKNIDPNTVRTEIVFESDEDDFEPCFETDKDEIEVNATKEMSFINNRIIFEEESEVSCDDKSGAEITDRMDCEDGQKIDDPVSDTPTMDPKLLMDTKVPLFKIDKTRAWKNNVRKDNTIRVSRIHKKYYMPKPKNKSINRKPPQNKRWDVELRTSARLSTSTTTEKQEIKVDKFCLDEVANTHSIRELCKTLKRELIEEQLELLEGKTPNKKAKPESDSEDDLPLLVLRCGTPSREPTDETEQKLVKEMVEESSSDDELVNNEILNRQGEERKGGRGAYAASTIEWSSAFAPALGRVAKRVSLPDIESVRRYNSGVQVAQVAPITSNVSRNGDDDMQPVQPSTDAAAVDTPEAAAAASGQHAVSESWDDAKLSTDVASHTSGLPTFRGNQDMPYGLLPSSPIKPLAWRTLDLPTDEELQAALDDLTTTPAAEAGQERTHCCAARRHREVNDSRRRIGLVEIPLHNHPEGECTCCCTHLSDADARIRLDQQLHALHRDIEQMLQKAAGGRIQSKPAQKYSRSPSPAQASTSETMPTAATSAPKQTTKVAPSNRAKVAKGSKNKPATVKNRPKRSRAKPPPTPDPEPPSPPVSDLEEWQRQKSMNAKYFHINSNISFKKDKTTAQDTAEQITTAQGPAVKSTTAQGPTVKITTAQGPAVNSTTAQGPTMKITTAQGPAVEKITAQATAVQSTTAQSHAVHSATAQGRAMKSTTPKRTVKRKTAHRVAVKSTTSQLTVIQSSIPQTVIKHSTIAESATLTKNISQPGLMPYIRHSPLVSPPEDPSSARRAVLVPSKHGLRHVAIAPKTVVMSSTVELASLNTVLVEPTTTNIATKNLAMNLYQSQPPTLRRMNLTTEQVSQSIQQVSQPIQPVQEMAVNSEPTEKPVSILEEYSRTLSTEPVNNTPMLNALSLRVPGSGPQGPKTTIVMALTLPSDEVIKQTINSLYTNDTVDLTQEQEQDTSKTAITNVCNKKITSPVDLVAAVKSLLNPANKSSGRSLLKPGTATKSRKSLLKSANKSALEATNLPATIVTEYKTSLTNNLHDGDVIEIFDTESDHSNNSNGTPFSNSNKSSTSINQSFNPDDYKVVNVVSKTVDSSYQAANGNEAVSKTNEGSSQAVKKGKNSKKRIRTKQSIERNKIRYKKPVLKINNVSVEAVSSHLVARPCSRIPVLASLTDGSLRCPARFANVAALTDFMTTLRRAAAQADKEVYRHKWSAVELPVSVLPCGGALLCVDGSRPPLVLPAKDSRDTLERRDPGTPNARAHLVLTEADPPCKLPTYWTLASFGKMARVIPDKLPNSDAADASDASDTPPRGGGAQWCPERGEWITAKEDRKICEKNHNFKILTAFCSADGIRQAARAGASLFLLSMLRARVVVLTLQREEVAGLIRHHASADVEKELLRELENLLDEAEIDEQLGVRADITD